MRRYEITDDSWNRIKDLLPGQERDPGGTAKHNHLFIDAVLWIAKTGVPQRDLPERFGNWNSVQKRFDRWARNGVWERVFRELQDPDLEWLLLNSTIIRAHQHAAAQKKGYRPRTRTGDIGPLPKRLLHQDPCIRQGLGLPVEIRLTPGQEVDVKQAKPLPEGYTPEAVSPPKRNRKQPRDFDKYLYKVRNLVERFINRIKQYRRVATRYEKTARNFLAFARVASIMILLQ